MSEEKCCCDHEAEMPKPKPEMTIYSGNLPEIKNFTVDGNYTLRVKVNIKKIGKGDEYGMMEMGGKEMKGMFARCEITSVEMDEPVEDDMESFKSKKVAAHNNRKM